METQPNHCPLRAFFQVVCLLGLITSIPIVALCDDDAQIVINGPGAAKIGAPFSVEVYIEPSSKKPVSVTLVADTPGVRFSEARFKLVGSQRKFLAVTFNSVPRAGLGYISASAEGYDDEVIVVDFGFDGHLKPTWTEPLVYDRPTTMSLDIVDKDGKPIPFPEILSLTLETTDGVLNEDKAHVGNDGKVEPASSSPMLIPGGSRASPQFQLRPRYARGGNVHLTAILTSGLPLHILAQDQFVFSAQPAWWLLVSLALSGGLLHGFYKILRLPPHHKVSLPRAMVVIVTSLIAGFVGYLFANFDLLGLKLDPNVLRTYPIVGFLFSYFGIETLLPKPTDGRSKAKSEHAGGDVSD